MNKKIQIPFTFVDITTDQFAVFEENHIPTNDEFDIDLKTTVNVSTTQKAVGVYTKYSFSQKGNLVLMIECGCHFDLDENYWISKVENNILTLDTKLLIHLLSLTIGTSRGIIHSKKPKRLNNLLLPTLNVNCIISKDMTFDLKAIEAETASN